MEEKPTIRQATLRIETAFQATFISKVLSFKDLSLAVDFAEFDTHENGERRQIGEHKLTEMVFDSLVAKLRRELKERGILVKEVL